MIARVLMKTAPLVNQSILDSGTKAIARHLPVSAVGIQVSEQQVLTSTSPRVLSRRLTIGTAMDASVLL